MHISEDLECRYCLDDDIENNLINPCGCSTPVHKSCLTKWIIEKCKQNRNYLDSLKCEICNLNFAPGIINKQEMMQQLEQHEGETLQSSEIIYVICFITTVAFASFIILVYFIQLNN